MKTRSYACIVKDCHNSFRCELDLSKHIKIHLHDDSNLSRTFLCKKCSREFGTKQGVKEHMYTHSVKKNFKCQELNCGKSFRQSSQLCNHKKVHRMAKDMLAKQSVEDQATDKMLVDLKNKVARSQLPEITNSTLPLINNPSVGIMLPKISSLYPLS